MVTYSMPGVDLDAIMMFKAMLFSIRHKQIEITFQLLCNGYFKVYE